MSKKTINAFVLTPNGNNVTDKCVTDLTDMILNSKDRSGLENADGVLVHSGPDLQDPAALVGLLKADPDARVAALIRNNTTIGLCHVENQPGGIPGLIELLESAAHNGVDSWEAVTAGNEKSKKKERRTMTADNAFKSVLEQKACVYESTASEPLAAYCKSSLQTNKTIPGTKEYRYRAPDITVYSSPIIITNTDRILNIEFDGISPGQNPSTRKDNMPLRWIPHTGIESLDTVLWMGLRTGATNKRFTMPAITIFANMRSVNICVPANSIRTTVIKDTDIILSEAGEAMSAYTYLAEPAYKNWLDHALGCMRTDKDLALWLSDNPMFTAHDLDMLHLPDTDRLIPNYQGVDNLETKRPSIHVLRGLQTAADLAEWQWTNSIPGTHEYNVAEQFAHTAWKILDHLRGTAVAVPVPGSEPKDRAGTTPFMITVHCDISTVVHGVSRTEFGTDYGVALACSPSEAEQKVRDFLGRQCSDSFTISVRDIKAEAMPDTGQMLHFYFFIP